jgi:hypothetical protein
MNRLAFEERQGDCFDAISMKTVKFGKDRSKERTIASLTKMCRTFSELTEVGPPVSLFSSLDPYSPSLLQAFDVFDLSGDGFVTEVEIGRIMVALGTPAEPHVLHAMLVAGDVNGDGELDLAEFVDFMGSEPWRSRHFQTPSTPHKRLSPS